MYEIYFDYKKDYANEDRKLWINQCINKEKLQGIIFSYDLMKK